MTMSGQLLTLWQAMCPSTCHAFAECGGSESSPCVCVHVGTELAYQCDQCWLNCRERRGTSPDDTGVAHFADGLPLSELQITNSYLSLPAFLPCATRELIPASPLRAVACGIDDLFCGARQSQLVPSRHMATPSSLRLRLRCAFDAKVLGVLNGADRILELLWHADHEQLANALARAGLSAITGPTFSVLGEAQVPAYHNLTMLRRHHSLVQRFFEHGLEVIPHLYWRNDGDLREWIRILRASDIHTVSRDFSRTKTGEQFSKQFSSLLALLRAVEKPVRVILVGIGARKALQVARQIHAVGCSTTIVSHDPVRLAINRGAEIYALGDGELAIRRRPELSRAHLAKTNIRTMSNALRRVERAAWAYDRSGERVRAE
jgi:hypothetical protein